MEDLPKPMESRSLLKSELNIEFNQTTQKPGSDRIVEVYSPEDALSLIQSQPDFQPLSDCLSWLSLRNKSSTDFKIEVPSPKTAQIVFSLVHNIIPHYWPLLEHPADLNHAQTRKNLVRCLSSIPGISAIASRLQILLKELPNLNKTQKSGQVEEISCLVNVLECILKKDAFLSTVLHELTNSITDPAKRNLLWKEIVALLAGGRILSLCSEADRVVNETSSSIEDSSWLARGNIYTAWLGRNCACLIQGLPRADQGAVKNVAQLFSRAIKIGYLDQFIEEAVSSLLAGATDDLSYYNAVLRHLTVNEQNNLIFSLIRLLSLRVRPFDVDELEPRERMLRRKVAAGATALISKITEGPDGCRKALVLWLSGTGAAGVSHGIYMIRVVIAALNCDQPCLKELFERCLSQFGDTLYIKHTPMLQQEVNVQIFLVTASYLHRSEPTYISSLSKSSIYINAISNRLSASSERASLLGMLVGTAISELVDPKEKRMSFSAEGVDSVDGRWYRSLTCVQDEVGSIEDLKPALANHAGKLSSKSKAESDHQRVNKLSSHQKPAASKIIAVEEVDAHFESEEEDLIAHEKPDSDVSDEDEDATLVQRNRPTAPVYIRDLIAGLRDTENFDRHKLALTNAPSLIRRKASFGSEVSEHIEELATQLVGLGDKYNMEDFQMLRLQSMIAVLVAQPLGMGQWFARTFFNGDYSMGQRTSVLTTLGLGARDLAGLGKEDAVMTGADAAIKNPFPSKMLPEKLHRIYAIEAKPVEAISEKLEESMIKPMAVEAADQLSGPNALKVRTFSSRMEVEKKRPKPIPNELAKIVADGFFFPLTGLWRIQLQVYGENNVHTSPFLLTHYIKTLSLILHAAGSSPLTLTQMTSEFWDLLLSLRPRASDVPVLEALLFGFMTILDINSDSQRRVADEHAKQLLETREWVQLVFERIGGGSEEGERVRMLAAGVLMRCREVIEKYQRMLLGDLADYM